MTVLAGPDREKRARVAVGTVARVAAAATVAGVALVVATAERSPLWLLGWALLLFAVLAAIGCLRHGRRHDHERGRAFAAVALVVSGPALFLSTYGMVTRECQIMAAIRCVDLGFEEDRPG